MNILTVCAVCKVSMGTKDGKGVGGVSHGICMQCMEKKRIEISEYIEDQKNKQKE